MRVETPLQANIRREFGEFLAETFRALDAADDFTNIVHSNLTRAELREIAYSLHGTLQAAKAAVYQQVINYID